MNKKRRIVIAGAALAVAAAVYAAFGAWRAERDAHTLMLYGNVDIREVDLGFRVAGRLMTMKVDEGDRVKAGQQLASLDAQPYRDALAAAEARVKQAEANVEKLRRGQRPQEVQQARAAVRAAQAAFDNAQRDLHRQQGLFESGASSQKSLDAARARHDELEANLLSAREALALAREGFRREDIAAAEAELAAALAQHAQASTQLADADLFAPSDGIILARIREPGAMLQQGAPVYTLSLDTPVYVRAYVGERDLGKVRPGATAFVTSDSSDKRYRGQVGFIAPRAEFTPKSVETTDLRTDLVYRLRIVISEADGGLRQGMPVTVQLPLDHGAD
jgi:membrane fusion protein YbhG